MVAPGSIEIDDWSLKEIPTDEFALPITSFRYIKSPSCSSIFWFAL